MNGEALLCVGLLTAIVQGGLQGRLLKKFGERRLVLTGISSATIAYFFYGCITDGRFMFVIMFANVMAYAVSPTMQAIASKAVGPREQGLMQGSLNAINSLSIIAGPLVGTTILARVGHLDPHDWRLGSSFFVCSFLSAMALLLSYLHFRREHERELQAA